MTTDEKDYATAPTELTELELFIYLYYNASENVQQSGQMPSNLFGMERDRVYCCPSR